MNGKKVQAELICLDDLPEEFRGTLASSAGRLVRKDGNVYCLSGRTVICCPDDPAGKELLYTFMRNGKGTVSGPGGAADLFARILNDACYTPEQAQIRACMIDPSASFCTVLFRSFASLEADLFTLVSTMAALEKRDILIPMEYRTVALVRERKNQTKEELKEFAEAVIGTMEDEGITGIRAGIGRTADGVTELHRSCREAMSAISLGNRFHSRERVFLYSDQALERIMDSIPAERKKEIRKEYFGQGAARWLSEDILETVRVFFRNDLNLTAASKQLFIHRNTLNYRLDKIRKETGLDLRSFQDAVIFKILTEIPDDTSTD